MYLSNKSLICLGVTLRPKRLLQKGKQDGDDDACLQTLSEADEENWRLSIEKLRTQLITF